MRWSFLAAPAAVGAIVLGGSCSQKSPEDVTPSAAPAPYTGAAADTAGARAGGLADSAAIRDTLGAHADSLKTHADSLQTNADSLPTRADSAVQRDSM